MSIKLETFDTEKFEVTYEIIPAVDPKTLATSSMAAKRASLHEDMQQLDQKIDFLEKKILKLNADIDKLTNNADGLDYIIAVASGILTGLIDSLFVGELNIDIEGATNKIDKKVADKIKDQVLKEKLEQAVKQAKEGAKKKGKKLSKSEIEEIKQQKAVNQTVDCLVSYILFLICVVDNLLGYVCRHCFVAGKLKAKGCGALG